MQLTRLTQGARRLIGLPQRELFLFVEAVIWLGLFRIVILTVPFRQIAPCLGSHMTETPFWEPNQARRLLASEVAIAVGRASRYVPWETKCLVQAMTGKKMLRRRRIESTLYLGVSKKSEEKLEGLQAHAWLRCGGQVILGGRSLKAFAVVSTFGAGGVMP